MFTYLSNFVFSKKVLFFLGSVLNILGLIYYLFIVKDFFWDYNVYLTAVENFNNGMSVYLTDDKYRFVYPPIFLYVISSLGDSFEKIYLIFFFASLILLFNEKLRMISIGVIVSSLVYFNGAPPFAVAIATGNLSIILNVWLIFLFFKSFESNFYKHLFLISIILFSLIKFNFLIYSVTLFLVTPNLKSFKFFLTIVVTTSFLYLIQFIFLNDLFIEFVSSLRTQTIGRESYDMGYGLNTIIFLGLNNFVLANIFSLIIGFILILLITNKHLILKGILGIETYKYLVLVLILLLNPRMMIYDSLFISGLTIPIFSYLNNMTNHSEHRLFLWIFLICFFSWFASHSLEFASILNFPVACIFLPLLVLFYKLMYLYKQRLKGLDT